MKKIFSRFLLILLALILMLSIGVIGFVYTFDIAKYKTELTEAFNDNTGLILSIEGDISLEVDEDLYLSLSKVTLSDSLGILAEADTLNLIVPILWPSGIINVKSAEVISPVYHFRTMGIIPFKTEVKETYNSSFITPSIVIDSFRIDSVSVSDGRFILYNRKDSIVLDVRNIKAVDADFAMLRFDDILKSFDVNAMAYFDHISAFGLTANNGNCQFRMIDGTLDFDAEYFRNQKGEFDVKMDLNSDDIRYHIKGISRGENLIDLFHRGRESVDWVKGKYNGNFDIKFILADSTIDMSTMSGRVQLESESTRIYGISLDKMVKSFKKTQNFSFKDLGSVMVFGPWGLALSKGGDYAGLALASQKDSTLIEYLHCQISIDTGMLEFEDLAFRT